jgi:peptide deformylase
MKELKLIPPTDPRVQSAIAPFTDDMLKEHDFKDRAELVEAMFLVMKKYAGIGLTCNQVGLPFNLFVAGGHPSVENGMSLAMFNPMIISSSEDTLMMKEGCLTYPYLFLNIKRPRKVVMKYEDSEGKLQEAHLDGMMSRICQHEYDHIIGRNFIEHVSKLKLDMAKKKAAKEITRIKRYMAQRKQA